MFKGETDKMRKSLFNSYLMKFASRALSIEKKSFALFASDWLQNEFSSGKNSNYSFCFCFSFFPACASKSDLGGCQASDVYGNLSLVGLTEN